MLSQEVDPLSNNDYVNVPVFLNISIIFETSNLSFLKAQDKGGFSQTSKI